MQFVEADSVKAGVQQISGGLHWFTFDNTISIIALTLGFLIFFISWFAGGKENISRIMFSLILSSVIGFFSMPLTIKAGTWLGLLDMSFGVTILITLQIIFVAALSVSVYELVTVSAREARPPD